MSVRFYQQVCFQWRLLEDGVKNQVPASSSQREISHSKEAVNTSPPRIKSVCGATVNIKKLDK